MVLTYHKRGVGVGAGPVQYLLGKEYDREDSELLRGDPDQTIDLIDSLDFQKKYTSGVLAFTESDLSGEVKNNIMDEFERATFCGMEKDQYNILWVQHKDKGNLELNFVIPNVELNTGKRFQPYWHQADKTRMSQFKDIQNFKYDLGDPNDPARKQLLTMSKNLPKEKKEIVKQLNEYFIKSIEEGTIKDRADITDQLSAAGFKIARENEKYLSIENPNGGQNIRLKGAIYEQSFRPDGQFRTELKNAVEQYPNHKQKSYTAIRKRHDEYIKRKSETHEKIYGKVRDQSIEKDVNQLTRGIDSGLSDLRTDLRNSSISRSKSNQLNKGIEGDQRRDRPIESIRNRDSEERGREEVPGTSRKHNTWESRNLGRQDIYRADGELKNDGDRNTIIESIKGFRERARNSAERAREKIVGFGESVRNSLGKLQRNKYESKEIGQQIKSLDRAIGKEVNRSRSKGMSFGGYDFF